MDPIYTIIAPVETEDQLPENVTENTVCLVVAEQHIIGAPNNSLNGFLRVFKDRQWTKVRAYELHTDFEPDFLPTVKPPLREITGEDAVKVANIAGKGYAKHSIAIPTPSGWIVPSDTQSHLDFFIDVSDEGEDFDWTICYTDNISIGRPDLIVDFLRSKYRLE